MNTQPEAPAKRAEVGRRPRTRFARALVALVAIAAPALAGCGGRDFVPATPAEFAEIENDYPDGEYRATTPDGVVLGVRSFENKPKASLDFWSRAVERRMRELGGYALLQKTDVVSRLSRARGKSFRFGRDEGREPFFYDIAIFVTDDRIFVVEAGGPKTEMQKQAARIDYFMRNFLPK
jgi:hypothetical protein